MIQLYHSEHVSEENEKNISKRYTVRKDIINFKTIF